MNDKLNQWLAVIDDMDGGRIKMAEEKNEKVKSALDEMTFLTGDAEVRRIAELRDKWEMDRLSEIDYVTKHTKLETAKKMLEKKIDVQTICEVTGLTKEEILSLN